MKLRSGDLHWRRLDDEIVLLDGRRSVYLELNQAGAVLWSLLADGADRDQLITRLIEVFGVEAEQAGADVDAFVAELRAKDLLA